MMNSPSMMNSSLKSMSFILLMNSSLISMRFIFTDVFIDDEESERARVAAAFALRQKLHLGMVNSSSMKTSERRISLISMMSSSSMTSSIPETA